MSLRKSGADCPYDAGGLRRGVLALATSEGRSGARLCLAIVVLLLACVLMAGAVSAGDITSLDDLKTALENATNGETVTLTQNITGATFSGAGAHAGYINIIGKSVTLDLNGYKINAALTNALAPGVTHKFIAVGNQSLADKANLTITGSGYITITNGTGNNANVGLSMFLVSNSSSLTIQNGEFTAPKRVIGSMGGNSGKFAQPTITINGGKLSVTEDDAVIYLQSNKSKLYINGGEIMGSTGIDARTGTLVMTGGTIKATGQPNTEEKKSGYSANTGSAISLTGMKTYEYALDIELKGGTVTSEHGFGILNYADGRNNAQTGERKVSLTGATVSGTLGAYGVNKTYDPTVQVSGTWTATTFDSVKALLEAGANVTVGNSLTITEPVVVGGSGYVKDHALINITKSVTLDLAGKHITAPTNTRFLNVSNAANLNLISNGGVGTIQMGTSANVNSAYELWTSEGVNVEKGSLTVGKDVTIYSNGRGIQMIGSDTSSDTDYSKVTIEKGATVKAPYGIYLRATGSNKGYGSVLHVYGTVMGVESTDTFGWMYGTVGIFVHGNFTSMTGNNIPQMCTRML